MIFHNRSGNNSLLNNIWIWIDNWSVLTNTLKKCIQVWAIKTSLLKLRVSRSAIFSQLEFTSKNYYMIFTMWWSHSHHDFSLREHSLNFLLWQHFNVNLDLLFIKLELVFSRKASFSFVHKNILWTIVCISDI